MSLVALGQGVPFFLAGDDLLRSKDMDNNSFDSGDWFNKLDFQLSVGQLGHRFTRRQPEPGQLAYHAASARQSCAHFRCPWTLRIPATPSANSWRFAAPPTFSYAHPRRSASQLALPKRRPQPRPRPHRHEARRLTVATSVAISTSSWSSTPPTVNCRFQNSTLMGLNLHFASCSKGFHRPDRRPIVIHSQTGTVSRTGTHNRCVRDGTAVAS